MKLNKYFSTLLGGLLLFGTWACTDKIEPEPTPAFDGADVYFSATASTDVDIKLNATEVAVNIYRVKADDALTVNLSTAFSTENEEGELVPVTDIFTAPATVTFAQGEKVAAIPVAVDFSKVQAGQDYYMTVKIEGDLTSVYGESEKTFTLSYSQWSDWDWYDTPATLVQWSINGGISESGEAGTLSSADLEESVDENGDYYFLFYSGQIITRKSLINDNLWMVGVGGARYRNFMFDLIFTIDNSRMVDVNGKQYPYVTFESFDTNYVDDSGASLFVGTCYDVLIEFGFVPGTDRWNNIWEANDLRECYYDPETGIIHYFPMYYFEGAESPMLPQESYVFLPGFADYSIEFAYNGNFVDKKGVESAVISMTRSDDVASYLYTLEFGALTDAQVETVGAELAANTELDLTYDVTKEVMFPLTDEGTYTVVAVMYDAKGNNVGVTSFQFQFESVMKETTWVDAGMAYFSDDIMTTFFTDYPGDTYEVACERYKEDPNIYRLVDPLVDWQQNSAFPGTGTTGYIYFDVTNPEAVVIIDSPLGLTCPQVFQSNEEMFLIDQAYGASEDIIDQYKMGGVMDEDGLITFPATFLYKGEDNPLMMLTTESLWAQSRGIPTNNNGYLEIYMPDSYFAQSEAVKAKANQAKTDKASLKVKKITAAERGFLSAAKRKAAKAEKLAKNLKEFKENRKLANF